jgi:hypothetical protein
LQETSGEGELVVLKSVQTTSMQIPMAKPVFSEKMLRAAIEALSNGRFVLGESVYKFDEEFARCCGVDCAVSARPLCFLVCSHQGGTF